VVVQAVEVQILLVLQTLVVVVELQEVMEKLAVQVLLL
jgi:hypothetical protein